MIGAVYEKERKKIVAILKNYPCSWNRCVFCCFSEEAARDLNDLMDTNKKILNKMEKITRENEVRRISIFNGGSFFELPLNIVLELAGIGNPKVFDIETRPEFLTKESTIHLFNILSPSNLVIRIGFETASERIRNDILNKGISNEELERIVELRKEIKKTHGDIDFIAYVLFGIDETNEEEVIESVKFFKRLFDGVIAIKYRRYHDWMPPEIAVSQELMSFLKNNCLDVDMTESEIWEIQKWA